MKPVAITEKLSVSPQIAPSDLPDIAAAGFTGLVANRPDGEEAGQPDAASIAEAGRRAGLGFALIPVPDLTEEKVRAFQKAVADSEGPVLAYCRTGTRSLTLWAIGEVLDGRMKSQEVAAFAAARGFDLSGAVKWLAAHGH